MPTSSRWTCAPRTTTRLTIDGGDRYLAVLFARRQPDRLRFRPRRQPADLRHECRRLRPDRASPSATAIYSTPVWSPRGDLIAFTKQSGGKFSIGVMKPDGSGERILTTGFHNEGPTWAPNGRVHDVLPPGRPVPAVRSSTRST